MREQFVGFSHLMGIFAPGDRGPLTTVRLRQFIGDALSHRLTPTTPTGIDDGPDRQCLGTTTAHLDGHLLGRTTDST